MTKRKPRPLRSLYTKEYVARFHDDDQIFLSSWMIWDKDVERLHKWLGHAISYLEQKGKE